MLSTEGLARQQSCSDVENGASPFFYSIAVADLIAFDIEAAFKQKLSGSFWQNQGSSLTSVLQRNVLGPFYFGLKCSGGVES